MWKWVKKRCVFGATSKYKMGGFGCLGGVPGTLGGAIRMNAGTSLGEISERVISVDWIDRKGILHTSTKRTFVFISKNQWFTRRCNCYINSL